MVISWVIILIIVFIGLAFLKIDHHTRVIKIFIVLALLLLIAFSMYNLFRVKEIDLSSPKDVVNTVYLYFGWLGNTLTQLWDVGKDTVTTVGNVIKINQSDIEIEKIDWEKEKTNVFTKITSFLKDKSK